MLGRRLALLAGLILLIALRLPYGTDNLVDDAYITLRHSLNLARGEGFLYNPGERVLGTTTPLYALMVGVISSVVGSEHTLRVAVTVNLLSDLASFFLLLRLGQLLLGEWWFGWAVAVSYGANLRCIEYSTGGMELSFYTAIMLGCAVCLAYRRLLPAAALAGLAMVCRPDGTLMLGWVLVLASWQRRALAWRELLVGLSFVVPWLVGATVYFGHPMSQSVLAKAARPFVIPRNHALDQLGWQWLGFWEGREFYLHRGLQIARAFRTANIFYAGTIFGALAHLALAAVGARAGVLRQQTVLVAFLVGYGILHFLMYAIGNPLMLGWYQMPLEPIGQLLIGAGLWLLGRKLFQAPALVLALLLVSLQLSQFITREGVSMEDGRPAMQFLMDRWIKKREQIYMDQSLKMNAYITPQTVIAIPEIGAFGYVSKAYILDPVGLVSPKAPQYNGLPPEMYMPGSNFAIQPRLINELKPDYVVSLEVFCGNSLLKDKTFLETYELIDQRPDAGGNSRLVVYKRKGSGDGG